MPIDIRIVRRNNGEYVVKNQGDYFDVWKIFIASDTRTPWFYYVDGPIRNEIIFAAFPQ